MSFSGEVFSHVVEVVGVEVVTLLPVVRVVYVNYFVSFFLAAS